MWKLVALTRHGRLDVVGSFDSFLIVFQVLRLVCVILVMTSSHLFSFSFVILSISLFPEYMVPRYKGCLNSCTCMFHLDFFIGQFDRKRILFDILLLCVF